MTKSPFFSATVILGWLLFAATLPYNGVGHSLHWLSIGGIILLLWLSTSIVKQDPARIRVAAGWLPALALAYAIWLFVNPFISTYPYVSSATGAQLSLLPLALLGWLVAPDENKNDAWRAIWALLLLSGVVLAIWGIADFILLSKRAHGPLIDANAYGALMNLLLIPAAYHYLNTSPPAARRINNPWLQLGAISLFSLALCMSLSRGALISLLVVLPLLLWFNRRVHGFVRRAGPLILALLCTYAITKAIPFGPSSDIETLVAAPIQQAEHDPSIQARFLMWKTTWKIIEHSNPLIGTGLGTYKNYYAIYRDAQETMSSGNLAHNDYLQALQEGGVIQLAFSITFAILAPLLLLYTRVRHPPDQGSSAVDATGLVLGVMAVSLHAFVNFIYYVAPITVLIGLYIARGWETLHPRSELNLLPFRREQIKPGFMKTLAIVLLAIPFGTLAIDGVIFKLFSSEEPPITRLAANTRFEVVNAALAIRPSNPEPRVFLIGNLLQFAAQTQAPKLREQLLRRAETEAKALIRTAPALASGRFFLGKIEVLRGSPKDLLMARYNLERAVTLVPPATGIRLELLKLYRRLHLRKEAYQTIVQARKWIFLEKDYRSLSAFAEQAHAVAVVANDKDTAEYWAWVHNRLGELGLAG